MVQPDHQQTGTADRRLLLLTGREGCHTEWRGRAEGGARHSENRAETLRPGNSRKQRERERGRDGERAYRFPYLVLS